MRSIRTPKVCQLAAVLLSSVFSLAVALSGSAQALDADAAELLVRETWYEGLPLEEAEKIDAAGAARLIEMLENRQDREHHANILMALAAGGQLGAYEAIAAWATLPRSGEVDRAHFRAWQALPHALGVLARRDPRALHLLAGQLDTPALDWRFRHHDGARIRQLTRRGAASGLAHSGRPEAAVMLQLAAGKATDDPAFQAHLRECQAQHRELERQAR